MQTCPCADATSHVDYGLEKVLSHLVRGSRLTKFLCPAPRHRHGVHTGSSGNTPQDQCHASVKLCQPLTHARATLRRCGMLNNASGMYLTASFHPPAPSDIPPAYLVPLRLQGGRGWRRRSGGALKPRWRAAGHGKRRRAHVNALGRPA